MTEATRDRLLSADAAARAAAQAQFDRPMVVEAGAGTGKTSILVARIVAWCLGPGWERVRDELGPGAPIEEVATRVVAGVVAITFTEAAAAEMAERVAGSLSLLGNGRVPTGVDPSALPANDVVSDRAGVLLGQLHRLKIRTIHSFCQWLLQSYPVDAGLDPAFTVDGDGAMVESAALEVVEEALRNAMSGNPDRRWLQLVSAGCGARDLVDALVVLETEAVQVALLEEEPFSSGALKLLFSDLQICLDQVFQAEDGRLQAVVRAARTSKTRAELVRLALRVQSTIEVASESLADVLSAVSGAGLKRVVGWGRERFTKTESAALGDAAPRFSGAARRLARRLGDLSELRPIELDTARHVVGALLARLRQRLRAQGVVTFQGLLTGARDLLADNRWLCSSLRRDLRQLLVDEFQDTDSVQCEIIRLLALEGSAGERPGLFIVGDPKQSIYGWRDADLVAYESFVESVRGLGGTVHRLSVNYRSPPAVLDEVRAVVEPVMEEEQGLQPPFEPLLACAEREESGGFDREPWGQVEHWVSWPRDTETGRASAAGTVARATELEARAVARDVVSLHQEAGVEWSAIAVLMRSTGDLDVVLSALRQAAVPFAVTRDREYFRRREVVEAAALVRCVVDPTDQMALLTVLRSDTVGVPDAALIPLWRSGFPAAMSGLSSADRDRLEPAERVVANAAAALPDGVPGLDRLPAWQLALNAAVGNIAALRESFAGDPPDLFVERLRTLWLGEATAAARYLGGHRRARLEVFFAELERVLVEGDGSRAQVARFLRRSVERGMELREPVASEVVADAVQVMTIHGAKGLDFDHVYLLQLHKGSRRRRRRQGRTTSVLRRGDQVQICLFGWPTPGFLEARRWADRVDQAERVRLLYVAMTRAKQRLVVAGRWPDHDRRVEPHLAESLIDLVVRRRGVAELQRQAEDGVERLRDGDVVWVLPDLATGGIAAAEAGPRRRAVSVAAIRRDAAGLEEDRQAAALRMARPLAEAASRSARRVVDREQSALRLVDGGGVLPRDVAVVVGNEVHRLLETLDLDGDLVAQVQERRPRVVEAVEVAVGGPDVEVARKRVHAVLDAVEVGSCLRRLQTVTVVARELPLVLPAEGETGPVGFVTARADLVYRDPADGSLVVADFKTDRVAQKADVEARVGVYRAQLELYTRGIQEALGLQTPPRAELWFLSLDRIVQL